MDNLYNWLCIIIMFPPYQLLSSLLEKIFISGGVGRAEKEKIKARVFFIHTRAAVPHRHWGLDISPSSMV